MVAAVLALGPILADVQFAEVAQDEEGLFAFVCLHDLIIVHRIIRMAVNTLNMSTFKIQQFYRMQLNVQEQPIFDKIKLPRRQKNMSISQRQRNFEISPPSVPVYNALEDKFAFGYFQNRSVQRHLKKLLKNAKQLPPSADTRRVITSLSEKILSPQANSTSLESVGAEKTETIQSVKYGRVKTEKSDDIYYPYKEDMRLKPLYKARRNIEKKEKLLRMVQEKQEYFPRLKATIEHTSHQRTMQKLIQAQERKLANKIVVASKISHKEFMSYLSNRPKAVSSIAKPSNNVTNFLQK